MEENRNKEKVSGYVGSIIFHAALIILFLFLGLTSKPLEEEGILVNFGDSPTGFGASEPVRNEPTGTQNIPSSTSAQATTPPLQTSKPATVKENIMTQNYEESAKINAEEQKRREAQQKKIEEERKQKEEQDRQKRIEDEKKRAEEAERQRLAEEQRKKDELAQQARSNVNQAFSKTDGTGTSEGVTQGTGNQGHLTGDPNATNRDGTGLGTSGNSFSLAGRSLVGSLPKPVDSCNEAGVIVVEVTVDKSGKVTAAQAIQRGSSNWNSCLIKAAEEAARKAKFNSDQNAAAAQKGTITYRFGFVSK